VKKFSVTFERWTHEDMESGDTDNRGFIIEDVSLRDAIRLGLEQPFPAWCGAYEPSDSRLDLVRWLSFHKWNDGTRDYYETGTIEDRSLHIPDNVTPASRRRICRLFNPA